MAYEAVYRLMLAAFAITMLLSSGQSEPVAQDDQAASGWHQFSATDIDGKARKMSEYKDKIVLVVNTASDCGLTPQYDALESIYEKYKGKGFVIVGFPCNDFGDQEPGNEQQIKKFCHENYKVSFPMYSKVHVKGTEQTKMYQWLIAQTGGKDIEWNFGKFLIGRDGQVLKRFGSRTKPDDAAVVGAIEKALSN